MPTLEGIPPRHNRPGRPSLFEWDSLELGKWWRFKAGEDFSTSVRAFQSTAHSAAKRLGFTAKTKTEGADLLVLFEAKQ